MPISIRYKLALGLSLLLLAFSCKATRQENSPVGNDSQYFMVALYSIGTGIDREANAMVKATIEKYEAKGYALTYEKQPWGKEGEINYCFNLRKLDTKVYDEFLKELKSQLSGRQAHIYEQKECYEPQ